MLSFPHASTTLFRGAQPPTWGHRLPRADLPTRARRSSTCRWSCCLHYIDIAAWGCVAMWYIEGHRVPDDALLELSILDNIPIQSMACHCFRTGCGNLHVGSCGFCGQSNGECKMELVGKTVRSTCKYMPHDCITTQPSNFRILVLGPILKRGSASTWVPQETHQDLRYRIPKARTRRKEEELVDTQCRGQAAQEVNREQPTIPKCCMCGKKQRPGARQTNFRWCAENGVQDLPQKNPSLGSLSHDSSIAVWREHPSPGHKAGQSRHLPGFAVD